MITIVDKEYIGKLIAASKYMAEKSIGETDQRSQIEYITGIIENLTDIALEIGGKKFAKIDVLSYELKLRKQIENEEW